jgi:NADH dehydrogenase FAD-containing subunit
MTQELAPPSADSVVTGEEARALGAQPATRPYRRPEHLVLWGLGPAHLRLLEYFKRNPLPHVRITVLSQQAQTFTPRKLARYVANELTLAQCMNDAEPLLQQAGVQWTGRQGRGLNVVSRTVLLDDGQTLGYDVLSINTGPLPHREAIEAAMPGAREHGLFVPPLEGFVHIWPKVCGLGRTRALRMAVIGPGIESFELALAVRQRMPTAAVTWIIGPHHGQDSGHSEALHQRMLQLLREQRVTVLYENVAAFTRDDVLLSSGALLACDVPILALSRSPAGWLATSGLTLQAEGAGVETDAQERSISHPEVFHVWRDSAVLASNVHALMRSAPTKLQAAPVRSAQFIYAGASHALWAWRGQFLQGRTVAWLKKFLKI